MRVTGRGHPPLLVLIHMCYPLCLADTSLLLAVLHTAHASRYHCFWLLLLLFWIFKIPLKQSLYSYTGSKMCDCYTSELLMFEVFWIEKRSHMLEIRPAVLKSKSWSQRMFVNFYFSSLSLSCYLCSHLWLYCTILLYYQSLRSSS